MTKYLVYRSWVEITRDDLTRDMRRRTMVAIDEFESIVNAAAHYNRAREFKWAAPHMQEPDVAACAEVVALAEKDHPVPRVPMPDEIRVALGRYRDQMRQEDPDRPL